MFLQATAKWMLRLKPIPQKDKLMFKAMPQKSQDESIGEAKCRWLLQT